jgi:hypothetical protein
MHSPTEENRGSADPAVESVEVSAYRIPTDRPESDGTLEWDSNGSDGEGKERRRLTPTKAEIALVGGALLAGTCLWGQRRR